MATLHGEIVAALSCTGGAGNARAIALYERLGFVVEGRQTWTTMVDGELQDSLLMGRKLP